MKKKYKIYPNKRLNKFEVRNIDTQEVMVRFKSWIDAKTVIDTLNREE